ncbi:MAG: protein tyrosine phosphatase family protein [Caldilineales bacterium]
MNTLDSITNFFQILPLIGTAGQPTAGQFTAIRDAGFELVVNLAMASSDNALADEAGIVGALGMEYVHIPVVWTNPTPDDLARFFTTMEANRGRRVFVHCALNYRVSSFMYLYRVLRLGADEEDARWDLLSIWEPDECWSNFIAAALAPDHR